jgi:hypothetical protein
MDGIAFETMTGILIYADDFFLSLVAMVLSHPHPILPPPQ